MEMRPVQSSNIEEIGYDPAARHMIIHFKNGNRYRYANISAEHHAALMAAESIGKHFHTHIRKAFAGEKIEA